MVNMNKFTLALITFPSKMSFLLGIPSLKRMASVQLCGNFLRNERPIRDLIDIDSTTFPQTWDDEERLAAMKLELMENLSLINLPPSLEKELYPVITQMAKNLILFLWGFGAVFADASRDFLFKFLSQVRFSNRGDVDSFATTRRHLQEDGAMRDENPGEVFMWACMIGDPVAIKGELNRNRNRIYASLNQESNLELFWMRYLGERPFDLRRFNAVPVATNQTVLQRMIRNGFLQGIDFAFSLLTMADKLVHLSENESASIISPTAWARLILQLDTPQDREAFYTQYAYGALLSVVLSWPYYDLFNDAVVELVDFLSVQQFREIALDLATFVSSSIRPYDKTNGDRFLFFWQSSSEDIRSQFIQSNLNNVKLRTILTSLSIEATVASEARCFAAVVDDMKRLDVLGPYLISEHGLFVRVFLIRRRLFECFKLFLSHLPVAELFRNHETVFREIAMNFNELYLAIHMDC